MSVNLNSLPPREGKFGWPWTEEKTLIPPAMFDGFTWPKISIVTPSYNQGEFIEETIRSVLLQNYPNLEYIIIDGGSTDNSVEIIKKYEKFLTFWISEKDKGQADAVNKGWNKCSGAVLSWLNADDLLLPGALFTIMEKAVAHPNFHLIYGQCEWFDEDGNIGIVGADYSFEKIIHKMGMWDIPQPAAFVSRGGLDKSGMLDVRLRQSLDKDLWMRLAATGNIYFLPVLVAKFRIHPNQLTQKNIHSSEFYSSIERLVSFQNLFALKNLPAQYQDVKQEILAGANLNVAIQGRSRSSYKIAFLYTLRALGYPQGLFKSRWIAHISTLFLGEKATTYLAQLRRRYFLRER